MTPGEDLKAARLAAKMTQEALAKAVGVKPRAIIRWEKDQNAPEPEHREALRALLGVSYGQAPGAAAVQAPLLVRLADLEALCDAQEDTIQENRKAIRLLQARARRLETALRRVLEEPGEEASSG